MSNKIEIKQKPQVQLWVKITATISLLTLIGVSLLFIVMNMKSEKSYADEDSTVKSLSIQPVLWVRADDNSSNSDGTTISNWDDKSTKNNDLHQTSSNLQPKFFKNSDHVNNLGLILFDGNDDYYKVNNNSSINTASNYTSKTIFTVFRTGLDIISPQVIWEEGGQQCGVNIYIEDGFIYTGIYNKKTNPNWSFFASETIEEDKAYAITFVYDYTNTFSATYLNGELVDSTHSAGKLSVHSGGIGVGNVNGKTLFHDAFSSKANSFPFSGALTELIYYDEALSSNDKEMIENDLTSDYYLNSESSSLPISLISFDAEITSNGVELSWSTASEINNDYFSLEKSYDGIHFEEFAQLSGAGNSQDVQAYSYLDLEERSNKIYYKLKQTDFDGKSEYFPVIHLHQSDASASTLEIINTYPNPFTSELNVEYNATQGGTLLFKLYDSRGVQVFSDQSEALEGYGSYVSSSLGNLAPGQYFYVLSIGNTKSSSVKVVK